MTSGDVATELHRLLEQAGVDPGAVTPDTPLSELYLDSVDVAEMREALHERFGIDLAPHELLAAATVGDARDLILAKVRAAG